MLLRARRTSQLRDNAFGKAALDACALDAGVPFGQSRFDLASGLACGGFDDFIIRRAELPDVFEGEAMVAHRAAHEQLVVGEDVYLGGEASPVTRMWERD